MMRRAARAMQRRSRRARLSCAVWLALFQALCMLASCQLSGLSHALEDVASACAFVASSDDCPDEKPGRECPPGCPSCHCAHPAASTPAPATFNGIAPPSEVSEALADVNEGLAPARAVTHGVWRPPRAA